jgi:hypothetical protein
MRGSGSRGAVLGAAPAAMLFATALIALVAVAALTGPRAEALAGPRGAAGATTGGFHPPRNAAQAHRAALEDARERLAEVVPPPGATAIESAPPGTHLAEPPSRIERGQAIDLARFWHTGESPGQVLRWFRAHHPGGTRLDDEGPLIFEGKAIRHVYSFESGELNYVASSRSVLVSVVPVADGTVIRVDSQASWEVPHPGAERIPPSAGFLKLERMIFKGHRKVAIKLHDQRRIRAIAERINRLPIVGPYARGHEEQNTGELRLTFRTREGGRELASVRYLVTVDFGYSVDVTIPRHNHANFVSHYGGRGLVRSLEPLFFPAG